METVIALLAAGTIGVVGAVRVRRRSFDRLQTRFELEVARQLVAEDVTALGEELERLDRSGGGELDEESRHDRQTALDAYESARRPLEGVCAVTEIHGVVDALTTGRFALARLVARTEGRPVPEDPTPCFFDPQHGPATTKVLWTQPGRGTRTVPACARDGERRAAGEDPELRMVRVGGRLVPYWEAGALIQPYVHGNLADDGPRPRRDSAGISRRVRDLRRDDRAFAESFSTYPGKKFDGDFQRRDPS
jgi:hypothetical protein